jgi:glycosyltransferase involved in cell wall biosynthesis
MKILFLTDNFPPEVNAPATRTHAHCRRWVEAGDEVTVITCAPNFPQGKVYPGYGNRLRSVESIDGIKVVRVWSFITANEGFIKRSLDYISFAVSAFFAGLFEKADVIVATSPQFFTTFAGFGLSLVKRRPWIFELRDLWPESIATVGALKQASRLYRWLEWTELFLYRRATRIVAVTPAFRDNLVRRGIPAQKVDVVTNGADLASFMPRPLNTALRDQLGVGDKFVIGYIGTHGMAHGLDFVLDTMVTLKDRQIHLLLVGDGAEKENLRARAAALDLSNVSFHDPVPKQAVADWLAACDVLLVPLKLSETFKTVIPSKIFEAAAMKRPILLGVDGQAREIVETFGAGVYFAPEDAQSFTGAALQLMTEEGLRASCGAGGKRLAAAYARDALATRMLAILRAVAGVD